MLSKTNENVCIYLSGLRLAGRRCYGVIYLLTNLDTGQAYVGQTTRAVPFDRVFAHQKCALSGGTNILYRAIRKYGWSAFRIEIIANCDSKKSLDAAEAYFIDLYQTLAPHGYNLKHGGAKGRFSEPFKRRLRRVHSTLEVSQKHREAIVACWADPEHTAKIKATWGVKNALSASTRAARKLEKEAVRLAARPVKIAKRNAAIKASHSKSEVKEKIALGTRNSRWICKGDESRRLKFGESLPGGWNYGRGEAHGR